MGALLSVVQEEWYEDEVRAEAVHRAAALEAVSAEARAAEILVQDRRLSQRHPCRPCFEAASEEERVVVALAAVAAPLEDR